MADKRCLCLRLPSSCAVSIVDRAQSPYSPTMTLLRIHFHVSITRITSSGTNPIRLAVLPFQTMANGYTLCELFCLAPPTRQPLLETATPVTQSLGTEDNIIDLGLFAHVWEWFDGYQSVYHSVGSAHRISRAPLVTRYSANSVQVPRGTIHP